MKSDEGRVSWLLYCMLFVLLVPLYIIKRIFRRDDK